VGEALPADAEGWTGFGLALPVAEDAVIHRGIALARILLAKVGFRSVCGRALRPIFTRLSVLRIVLRKIKLLWFFIT
jgi:hypothetical protein